jgi:enoyl-[acyl-carrier protein] reductase I
MHRMGLFDGKQGLILGVANDHSIAWHIAKTVMDQGGVCGFTHLPDKPEDDKKKNRRRVAMCTENYADQSKVKFLVPMNVQDDADIASVAAHAKEQFGKLDFVLHSIAFASLEDLKGDTIGTSRDGFKLAMEISVYSFIAVANALKDIMAPKSAMVTMTYFGGEKIVQGYNVMAICKAALDCTTKYLAYDLGPRGVRVNALSAGPLKTLAGSAAGVKEMIGYYEHVAPLGRNVTHEEVGRVGAFLLSDMSDGITAEIMHVDCGYNAMGSPGRLAEKLKAQ